MLTSARGHGTLFVVMGRLDRESAVSDFTPSAKRNFLSFKYGIAPAVSKLVIVELGKAPEGGSPEEGVLALFKEYLKDVRREGDQLEGRNQAGRWFLFKRVGAIAVLVLGDPDEAAARSRLDAAISRVAR